MSDAPKFGGYQWELEIDRGQSANDRVAEILQQLIEGHHGPVARAALLSSAALALRTNLDALAKLREIGRNAKKNREECRAASRHSSPPVGG